MLLRLALVPLALAVVPVGALTLPVAPGGPSFEQVRDQIRALRKAGPLPAGGVTVEVAAGTYELAQPLDLGAADAGTPEAPIVWRAKPGATVRLLGGRLVKGWRPVTDQRVLDTLAPAARGKVVCADLKAQGITDYGKMGGGFALGGGPGLEVFCRDTPLTLARYPNDGFLKITGVEGPTLVDVRGTKGCKEGIFTCDSDRLARWAQEPEPWALGYWFWDWAEGRQRIAKIDVDAKRLTLAPPHHGYGYRRNQWFYVYNALCELDQPGEWYLDREQGVLYLLPDAPVADGDVMVTVLPTMAKLEGASHVTLRGFTLEGCRGSAINLNNCVGAQVIGCTIRNLGSNAVSVNGGRTCRVAGCDIYATGDGGVTLTGGDRKTLTPAGHVVENCHIHHYSRWNRMYRPAVMLQGVGNRAAHNLIHNAPHMAMGFGGNDHVMEFNEIHSVCYESNDAGAIYTGRNWTMRGHVLRHNYLHHIYGHEAQGCMGIYLDDQFSSATIFGNLFYQVPRAAFIGGGRDNVVENNVFVDCSPAFHLDARGLGWAAPGREGMLKGLNDMPYRDKPWSERYPQLLKLLDDEPMAPRNNRLARNLCSGGRWQSVEGKARPGLIEQDNLVSTDLGFVDAAKLDFRLKPDSPAFKIGFQPLPLEQIGLRRSDERATWPVQHTVRPAPVRPPQPPRRSGPAPLATAPRLTAEQWAARTPQQALVIEEGIQREKVKPRSLAWVAHDGTALLVAFDHEVDKAKPLRRGNTWGQDDAVEIALRTAPEGPILVLRGYPSGHHEASDEAGAPPAAVKRATEGVTYTAQVVDAGRWTCTWRIPLAALGLDPAKDAAVEFNLSVRKTAGDQWLMWAGTLAHTWDVRDAGRLRLGR